MSRITTKDIMDAIRQRVAECVPEAEHIKGRLDEGFSRPAFLYVPTYGGENKQNYFTSRKNVEMQIIYFGKMDGYGNEDYDDRLDTEARLEPFLSQHSLPVGDRYLHFTYEVKEADKQMAIYLAFRFLDEALDQAFIDRENADLAGSVKVDVSMKAKAE